MNSNSNSLVPKIKSLLATKEELNKKQVALFLTQSKIEELDEIVKKLSNYSNGKVNRNILIEMAIENLIECIPEVIRQYEKENSKSEREFDAIICPAQDGGQEFLKKNHRWEYVKLDSNKIKYLKYLVLYVGAPYSAIQYWVEIKDFKEVNIDNQKKYIIYTDDNIHEITPEIPLGNISPLHTRSPRYIKLDDVLKAHTFSDII